MSQSLILPPKIYTIFTFFDKTKDKNWQENPFVFYKKIEDLDIKIAKNISQLNFYLVDIPFSKQINPSYLIKYFKNIDYRNAFSVNTIIFTLLSQTDPNNWKEEEEYKGTKIVYDITSNNYNIVFYNDKIEEEQSILRAKYYHAFKILQEDKNYILRFEIVLNQCDLDQDIDLSIYVQMIVKLLKTIHNKFKIPYTITNEPKIDESFLDKSEKKNRSKKIKSKYGGLSENLNDHSSSSEESNSGNIKTPAKESSCFCWCI